jgi:aquaporin Z
MRARIRAGYFVFIFSRVSLEEASMKYFAELFGTLVLVFAGLGTAVLAGGKVGPVGISLAFGLTLVALAYSVGPISGCHINPAVTVAMLLAKRIKTGEAAGYIVMQVVGAVIGAALVLVIAQGAPGFVLSPDTFGVNGYADHSPGHYSLAASFVTESMFTMLLVFTVLGATDQAAPQGFAGLPIGFMLAVTNFASIPVTNASINPARSIGPAVLAGGWGIEQLWLFIVAPIAGGIFAGIIYMSVTAGKTEKVMTKGAGN